MRSKNAAFLALLNGDGVDPVALVEIATSGDPLRYALDTEARVWNGVSWAAAPGGFGQIQESAEREVPKLQMVLQNFDGVLGTLAHPKVEGGEDLRGRRVTLRQASRAMLTGATAADLVIEWVFFIESYQWLGRQAIVFDLGVFPAESIRVPGRTCQGIRCWWKNNYKGPHCGSTSDLPDCPGTVTACRERFEADEPLRFGGFPTAADARALLVD